MNITNVLLKYLEQAMQISLHALNDLAQIFRIILEIYIIHFEDL
jgi:hypothetical protein